MNSRMLKSAAFLGGCCFFCASLEYAVPKPLPFLRLGIANVPLMAALHVLPFPAVCLVAALKIAGQALISGTLFSPLALLSAAGTCTSAAVMYVLYILFYKKKLISWVGISIAGAAASNAVQLLLASVTFMGAGARYLVPVFLGAGTVTGTVLGCLCQRYFSASHFLPLLNPENMPDEFAAARVPDVEKEGARSGVFAGCFCLAAFLLLPEIAKRFVPQGAHAAAESFVLLFLSLCFMAVLRCRKNTVKILPWIVTVAAVVISNLPVPAGRVLCYAGSFPVTENALFTGLKRAGTFECMIFISRLMISSHWHIPGKAGRLLAQSFSFFGLLTRIPHHGIRSIKKITADEIDRILENVFSGTAGKPDVILQSSGYERQDSANAR